MNFFKFRHQFILMVFFTFTLVLVFFQNCGPGFQRADLGEVNSGSQDERPTESFNQENFVSDQNNDSLVDENNSEISDFSDPNQVAWPTVEDDNNLSDNEDYSFEQIGDEDQSSDIIPISGGEDSSSQLGSNDGVDTASRLPSEFKEPRIYSFLASPTKLAIVINLGKVTRGTYGPYFYQKGDRITGTSEHALYRNGKQIGVLRLPDGKEYTASSALNGHSLYTFDQFSDDELLSAIKSPNANGKVGSSIDNYSYYIIKSTKGLDESYQSGSKPVGIYRHTQPIKSAVTSPYLQDYRMITRTVLFLELPQQLRDQEVYHVEFNSGEDQFTVQYKHDSKLNWTQVIKVNQMGYHPHAKHKQAYMAEWMGFSVGKQKEGFVDFSEFKEFHLINGNSEIEFTGSVVLSQSQQEKDKSNNGGEFYNLNKADVYLMDFGAFKKEGAYKIYVPGLGVSWPFRIYKELYLDLFKIGMNAILFQRNGVELTKQHGLGLSSRPRDRHPDDGAIYHLTTTRISETDNGLNLSGKSKFDVAKTTTGETVKWAWGAHRDAGDWDVRYSALDMADKLVEFSRLYPGFVKKVRLNIPDAHPSIPDTLMEAKWSIDFFKRGQDSQGPLGQPRGIYGGHELDSYSGMGETSWDQGSRLFVYAKERWSSYLYTRTAARFAYVLKSYDLNLSSEYLQSAIDAYNWAQNEVDHLNEKSGQDNNIWNSRVEAALMLYLATGNSKYHNDFLAQFKYHPGVTLNDWFFRQWNAAKSYVSFPSNRETHVITLAETQKAFSNWSSVNKKPVGGFGNFSDPWEPMFFGNTPTSPVLSGRFLVHALALNKSNSEMVSKFRNMMESDLQFGFGCNLQGLSYYTGVGYMRSDDVALVVDELMARKKIPVGIVLFGTAQKNKEPGIYAANYVKPFSFPSWPSDFPTNALRAGYEKNIMLSEYQIDSKLIYLPLVAGALAATAEEQ